MYCSFFLKESESEIYFYVRRSLETSLNTMANRVFEKRSEVDYFKGEENIKEIWDRLRK